MEFFGLLAPAAFIFALAAISQITALRKQVEKLEAEIERIKGQK